MKRFNKLNLHTHTHLCVQKSIFWILCLFLMGSWVDLKGQEGMCYTGSPPNFLTNIPTNEFKLSEEGYIFRIYVHIIRDGEGQGGRTLGEVETLMTVLNNPTFLPPILKKRELLY